MHVRRSEDNFQVVFFLLGPGCLGVTLLWQVLLTSETSHLCTVGLVKNVSKMILCIKKEHGESNLDILLSWRKFKDSCFP